MRGGAVVSTLTGAFGQSLSETRLTAMLGYIIALYPDALMPLFGFSGLAQRVSLETRHEEGRSDILVETNTGTGLIEAKIDATDPAMQARRYPSAWKALLTHRPSRVVNRKLRYVSWQELAEELERLGGTGSSEFRFLKRDFIEYLKEHGMARVRKSFEIYAREINEPITLELFLQAQLYGCNYQAGSRLGDALYFAPHFGHRITELHPGVNVGISYVAKIEFLGHASTWPEFQDLMLEQRGRTWWKRHSALLTQLKRKWTWGKENHRSFLLLGSPRLAFNPAVRKESFQKGVGQLNQRFFSFDELFSAWGK